jgi:aryl-alcohol dehydrogenase-like predicted oxidoreductase
MKFRRLGTTGVKVSVFGLGGNTFGRSVDAEGTERIIHAALDVGINFFDTADYYGNHQSEEFIGRALAGRRQHAIVATKVGWTAGPGPNDDGATRAHIMDAVHTSLRRFRSEYVDLLQIHRWDPNTPIDETLRALDDLVRQGKIRYIGCSNFSAWQLTRALWTSDRHGWTPFVSVQPEYSLLVRGIEDELVPACQAFGIGIIPYFPLAGGTLTGKYKEGEPPPAGTRGQMLAQFMHRFLIPRNFEIVRRLEAWADARGHTVAELAIAWLLTRPMVSTVITGINKPEHLSTNVKAVDWELTAAEAEEVAALAPPATR